MTQTVRVFGSYVKAKGFIDENGVVGGGGGGGGSSDTEFDSGHGIVFDGAGDNPTTVVGGDDGYGDTAVVFDNADEYLVFSYNQYSDIYFPFGTTLYGGPTDAGITIEIPAASGSNNNSSITIKTDGAEDGDGGNIQIQAGDSSGGRNGSISLMIDGGSHFIGLNGDTGAVTLQGTTINFVGSIGSITFNDETILRTGVNPGDILSLGPYDVDGADWRRALTITAGNAPALDITNTDGVSVGIQASEYRSSDGSSGVTQPDVVGATATFQIKNGLIVGIA